MSHHFDTPTAQEDPRINVCDFYLFRGRAGTTVMAMTVNPDAGLSAPDTFRDEGLYAFRFDLDGDAREDVTFKVRFGVPGHAEGAAHRHVQAMEVRRAIGEDARRGVDGELLVKGRTSDVAGSEKDVRAWAGLAPDLFAGDGAALGRFRKALFEDGRYDPAAFENRRNFFAGRNVTAIVIEVPSEMIGRGRVQAWATASLCGHAPEVQVSRWGLPLVTNIFMPEAAMKEDFNRATPGEDAARFGPQIATVAQTLTSFAGSAVDPAAYGASLAARLCPVVLPYELDTPASFDLARFNGRALEDDVMDVILTLATNMPLADGVTPDPSRMSTDFPYYAAPFSVDEQRGLPALPFGVNRKMAEH